MRLTNCFPKDRIYSSRSTHSNNGCYHKIIATLPVSHPTTSTQSKTPQRPAQQAPSSNPPSPLTWGPWNVLGSLTVAHLRLACPTQGRPVLAQTHLNSSRVGTPVGLGVSIDSQVLGPRAPQQHPGTKGSSDCTRSTSFCRLVYTPDDRLHAFIALRVTEHESGVSLLSGSGWSLHGLNSWSWPEWPVSTLC